MSIFVHDQTVLDDLRAKFGAGSLSTQSTVDGVPTAWLTRETVRGVLRYLKTDVARPYRTLFDLTAIDERTRGKREYQPESDFTVVYHLLSYERNSDIRLKVPLKEADLSLRTITDIYANANWYEREVWDMFGVRFDGHPCLRRILMPPTWEGHPLRKDHPARATEIGPFTLTPQRQEELQEALTFRPEDWGLTPQGGDEEFMYLNLGPQHPGTHGPFRIILQLRGEEIVDAIPDIGYHHRGAEKMAERQSWHTYIPYTDRVDYLSGVMNNLAYLLPVEQLAGIEVPDRAKVIRIMMAELFRIASHLVWYGTFAQDLGAQSPVFYMFNDRERVLEVVEAVCGFRMHPGWYRIGGVAADLPEGWDTLIRELLAYLPRRLREYDDLVLGNAIFKARTQGIGAYNLDEAMEWGISGGALRACGLDWDLRKKRPYMGYEQFDFDVPLAAKGDCYDRAAVKVEEMNQSLRIIEQCLNNMPAGPYKSSHPLTTPPVKPYTMRDIETLIHHFLGVSWGPVMPAGESFFSIESSKGAYGYYAISDGDVIPYRMRIRTPSFANLQILPLITRGYLIPDLTATLGSIDFVLADVDR